MKEETKELETITIEEDLDKKKVNKVEMQKSISFFYKI
jgi:hypothetical protein